MNEPRYVSGQELLNVIGPADAVHALRQALMDGFNPADDLHRASEPLGGDRAMLLMPSYTNEFAGIKVLTSAPENPASGLDLIQGLYLLFDGETLSPRLTLDGVALTDMRTPAASFAAVLDAVLASSKPIRAVIFGGGHQGVGHVATLRDIVRGSRDVADVACVVRHPGDVPAGCDRVLRSGTPEVDDALAQANVVVTATPASTPLFDGSLVRDDAVVIAVGSHSPAARELDGALLGRGQVIVEDVATAMREAGDVIQAVNEGHLAVDDLLSMKDVVCGQASMNSDSPVIFKGVGMPWEDLVVASAYATASAQ